VRLPTKLALGLITTTAVVLGTYGWVQVRDEEHDLRATAERELRLLAATLQIAFENAFRDRQVTDVRKILESLELRDSSLDVLLFDAAASPGPQSGGSYTSQRPALEAVLELRRTGQPVVHFEGDRSLSRLIGAFPLRADDGSNIGSFAVVRPLDDVRADVEATKSAIAASVLSQIAGLGLVSWVLVFLFVRRPLEAIRRGMRAVKEGNLLARVPAAGHDEVTEVMSEFNGMVEELDRTRRQLAAETESRHALEAGLQRVDKLVTVGQLSAGLAHEIGSPLQILNGRAQALLSRSDASPEIRRNAEILVAESERMTRIVEQLLRFARRKEPHLTNIDAGAAVQAVADLLSYEARKRRVEIVIERDPNLPHIEADGDQVQQVVLNLLTNALKAAPAGSAVLVSMASSTFTPPAGGPAQPSVCLVVIDSGPGMDETRLTRAFEPFFTSWTDSQGSGLGLAVVKAIVTDHGGAVALSSMAGKGTQATVHLPVHPRGSTQEVA
jgi:signal transduction histidine kinase